MEKELENKDTKEITKITRKIKKTIKNNEMLLREESIKNKNLIRKTNKKGQ